MQVLLGLGVVTIIYFVTRFLGLYMTSWILQELGTVLIVLIIVVFQAEIRQALYRFSLMRHFFGSRQGPQQLSRFHEIVDTLFYLAEKRTGAIVVFQRSESLTDLMLNGVTLDCEITPQMLEAIFYDGAPLHDGAALIRDGRIALASCHLPMASCAPNRFAPQILMMPSTRAEIWVAYRDAKGSLTIPPAGAQAIFRTAGFNTGPTGRVSLRASRFPARNDRPPH